MKDTRSKPASEIHKLTELYKQILLLGNCGLLIETMKALCHRRGERGQRGETDKTLKNRLKH